MESDYQKIYKERVIPALTEKHGYKNVNEVPRLLKIVLNTSTGSSADGKAALDAAKKELAMITGQTPAETRSKTSIANFKLREGQAIGAKVTLRGTRMYEFLTRFIYMALPRIRDFRGIPVKSFDGNGNYTLGVSDQTIFPEIELDKITRQTGFDITFVTSAKTDAEAKSLLEEMGFPFVDKVKNAGKAA